MADIPIGAPHALANLPPVVMPVALPATPLGQIDLVVTWQEWLPLGGGMYLPFQLEADDLILTAITPTTSNSDRLGYSGMTLLASGGWAVTTVPAGVGAYRVADVTGPQTLFVSGAGTKMKVFFAVYRGVEEIRADQQGIDWNVTHTELSAHQAPIPYVAAAAQVANITYAQIFPQLSPFSYTPDYGHTTDVVPTADYPIYPNWQVTLDFANGRYPSPTPDIQVYSQGAWDAAYETAYWGVANYYTFILMTQQVHLLFEDPGNPAPAGNAHLPIRGL